MRGFRQVVQNTIQSTRITLTVLALLAPLPAASQQVEISSPDETVRVIGDMLGFDGTNYTIGTSLGELSFPATDVICTGDACPYIKPPASEFAISGSRALSELLMPALMGSYSQQLASKISLSDGEEGKLFTITDAEADDLAKVEIIASNSSAGITSLLQGDSSLALSSRPARAREEQAFEASGLGKIRNTALEHVLALDGLLVVTSPQNPLRAITEENISLVFAGEINNWSEIGGPDAPIRVYALSKNSSTGELFDNILLRPQELSLRGDAITVQNDAELSGAVAKDPFGIGFTSFVHRKGAKPLEIQGVCGLRTPPSEFAIKTEEYPLTRRLYAYSTEREEPLHVQTFVDFATSSLAQNAVAKAGFIDQSISSSDISAQGLRFASAIIASNRSSGELPELKRMATAMLGSERLSTTFRFLTGASELDNRAKDDVIRLAEELAKPKNSGKLIQLIGFTDSIGDPSLNKQLSERRAEQVRDAIIQQDPSLAEKVNFRPSGYGEVSPLGCNETESGRLVNRRVEVWIKDNPAGSTN